MEKIIIDTLDKMGDHIGLIGLIIENEKDSIPEKIRNKILANVQILNSCKNVIAGYYELQEKAKKLLEQ